MTHNGVSHRWAAVLAAGLILALGVAAPASAQTLIAKGATWKYLDDGSDQGEKWRERDFDDSSWQSGLAQLGYGDDDEATAIGYGPDSRDKYTTTYFRHTFDVKDPSTIKGLAIRLLRDDGAVVYLNGKELFRSNMPEGLVDSKTYASAVVGGANEDKFFEETASAESLVAGKNVLAVELHQANAASSDLGFDLELRASGSGGGTGATTGVSSGDGSTLVATGSTWKYLDNGSDQGADWRKKDFEDSGWSSGAAKLGYGDSDTVTEVGYGSDSQDKYPTTYFRHRFKVADASKFEEIFLRVRRDDGAVVFLNGEEIWRTNMPYGEISYLTYASETVGGADEKTFFETTVSSSALVDGDNVLAVEIHQRGAASSDLGFDLELRGLAKKD